MSKLKMLKKNYEFRYVLTKGKYISGNYIEVFVLANKKEHNLIGIAISAKICNAVNRNRIKRLIRENFRTINLEQGSSIVILWKKKVPIEQANYNNIREDMQKIFSKADILKEKI